MTKGRVILKNFNKRETNARQNILTKNRRKLMVKKNKTRSRKRKRAEDVVDARDTPKKNSGK
jgi:hypothetical protein